jgi:superfamily II DNA/RNA helicase
MGAKGGRKRAPTEMRTAPDGIRYTKPDFFAFFAGYDEWDAAAPVAANDMLPQVLPPAPAGGVETDHRRANPRTTSTTLSHLSDSTFDSLSLHPPLQRAITEVFHYERMTLVQQLAIPVCIDSADRDVVAKARTGTGKTLGFLLPALHRVLSGPPSPGATCPILVLSPTRELATQTAEEAKDLLRFVSPSKVMTVLGGTSMPKDVASFQQAPPVLLVATPGRLDDHLNNTAGVREMLTALCVLVMDEADQLLDRGFRPSIVKILAMLPPPGTRQTLLFSATFPAELQEVPLPRPEPFPTPPRSLGRC